MDSKNKKYSIAVMDFDSFNCQYYNTILKPLI